DNTHKARQLHKADRLALQNGNSAQAKQDADQARALKPDLAWWEETPDKIVAEIREMEAKKQTAVASTAAADSSQTSDPRPLLKQARDLSNAGKLEEAQTLAQKANNMPTHWGLFEDSPDKLMLDLRKARLK